MTVLVFDIGATKTRFALSSNGVQLGEPHIIPTDPSAEGINNIVAEMKRFATGHDLQQIGGGIAGTSDTEKGVVLESPNLPNWQNVPVGELIQKAFGIWPVIENDTAVVGLGEALLHGSDGISVYVTVSTGVNGARIVDGRIDRGAYNFEAGRALIPTAGGQSSLEEAIGGRALQERYGRLPREIDSPELWKREAEYLAEGLYNMMLMWSPQRFILGGSMMRDIPMEHVVVKLHALPRVYPEWPEVLAAQLGDLGGLYGALELLRQHKDA